jgi:hypothetical protein
MVGHERRQEVIKVLGSLPECISGALQRLSVQQCLHHVCCLQFKYTAVVEAELLLPAEKRARKREVSFRVKRERLEILYTHSG